MLVRKLIVPAAGAGIRLLPLTRLAPKEMLPIAGKPMCYYVVKEAYLVGIREIIFVIHPSKGSMRRYFCDAFGKTAIKEFPKARFHFIETKNRFGDGHAIFLARNKIKKGEAFAVSMPDLIVLPRESILKELCAAYGRFHEPIVSVRRVPKKYVSNYGIVNGEPIGSGLHEVADIVEKPAAWKAPSALALSGKYILTKGIFNYIGSRLRNRKGNEEVKLADALNDYACEHRLLALKTVGKHFDAGNKIDLAATRTVFSK